jgi:hypothetical protein
MVGGYVIDVATGFFGLMEKLVGCAISGCRVC